MPFEDRRRIPQSELRYVSYFTRIGDSVAAVSQRDIAYCFCNYRRVACSGSNVMMIRNASNGDYNEDEN